MKASEFRKALQRVMPGYTWTLHRYGHDRGRVATGIQSAGFNRLSTLEVQYIHEDGKSPIYEAKSAGTGRRAPWLYTVTAPTLAQALRQLQQHYEAMASLYRKHANDLQRGRPPRKPVQTEGGG